MDKLLTVKQVAQELSITEEHTRALIREGKIKGIKVGTWRVRESALQQYVGGGGSDGQ